MSSEENADRTGTDSALSKALAKRYGKLTRRSFLSVVTRKLVTFAGVPLAAQVFPYFVSTAHAANENCGLHGYICTAGCTGGANQLMWVQCCITQECPTKYQCCKYIDKCGVRPAGWPGGCIGDADGDAWCTSGEYICTVTQCDFTKYANLSSCQSGCIGPAC
jgi:hypothetical protein